MYKRIILKLSGETLSPVSGKGTFDPERVDKVADMILRLSKTGVQVGVVMGGGNIWRGRFTNEMNGANADQMGMLATVINALCVSDAIVRMGGKAQVFTAQEMNRFARLYTRDAVLAAMNDGCVALLAGGTGNPYFTTDTCAALRAAELDADAVFKGTTVDGVYDKDPRTNPDAKLLTEVTYQEAVEKRLKVMDTSAFLLCQEQKIPEIRVFNMDDLENIIKAAMGEDIGTRVHA
ncbi:MAG: UMP kinase [Clostridia bacterium]|nr:UMP kinase [Clostridia bacterium]